MSKHTLIINILMSVAIVLWCVFGTVGAHGQSNGQEFNFDTSTPEKTVYHFYEAFRTGNPDMLAGVLIEGGTYADFSPQYKIGTPNPVIAGAEIIRKAVVKRWDGSGEPVEVGDVLAYVVTKKDPKFVVRKPGVAMPDEKFCFVLRKVNDQWKLVKVYSGWPTFLNP